MYIALVNHESTSKSANTVTLVGFLDQPASSPVPDPNGTVEIRARAPVDKNEPLESGLFGETGMPARAFPPILPSK